MLLIKEIYKIDKSIVQDKYEIFQDENEEYLVESKILYLKYLISLNNAVYEPYLDLMNIYFRERRNENAVKIIQEGYNNLLKNEFDNKLPNVLDYNELHNRPIFRLIYNYADTFWFFGNKEESLKLFKKLLRMHSSDNIGARYAICAIFEGYGCSNHLWNERGNNIEEWFKENMKKHINKDGFNWMKSYLTKH